MLRSDKRITYQSLGLDKNKALRDEVLYFLAGVERYLSYPQYTINTDK